MPEPVEERREQLETFWLARGCRALRAGEPSLDPLLDPRLFFALFDTAPTSVVLCQDLRVPAAARPSPGLVPGSRETVVRVLLRPAPREALELFAEGLKRAGVDPLDHDLRLEPYEGSLEEFGLHRVGWHGRLDGEPVGGACRITTAAGRRLEAPTLELTFRLERLAAVVGELGLADPEAEWQLAEAILTALPPEPLAHSIALRLDVVERLLELALPLAAWSWIVQCWRDLEILRFREAIGPQRRSEERRRLAAAVIDAVHAVVASPRLSSPGARAAP